MRLNSEFELAFLLCIFMLSFFAQVPRPFLFFAFSEFYKLQVPVSIADLGGTEIDLRFASSKEGRLFVIVAPVLRFADGAFPT